MPRSGSLILLSCLSAMVAGCFEPQQATQTSHTRASPASRGIEPPTAAVRPYEMTIHGETRIDNYYWLRDDERRSRDVLGYLEAENEYTRKILEHTEPLQQKLYQELIGRMKQDDNTVPYRLGEYWYYARYEEGKEYPIYARRRRGLRDEEEIIVDVNDLAAPHKFYRLGNFSVTEDGRLLAYAEDTVSRGQYVIRFKNLVTGELYPDSIAETSGAIAWANDNRTLLYIREQAITLIPNQVYRHELGADEDELLYEERDSTFSLSLWKSRSREKILLSASSTLSTEMLIMDASNPRAGFEPFLPREPNHEYSIEPVGKSAYVRTNWNADNFRLMKAPLATSRDKDTWREIIPNRADVFLNDFTAFDEYLAVEERDQGLLRIRIIPLDGKAAAFIGSDEEAYTAQLDTSPNMDTTLLRYAYSSLATPQTIYDYDMATGEKTLRKQEQVLGGFDRTAYTTRRVHAPARDGARIPVTLFYRAGTEPDGTHRLYILGYGAYGASYDPVFRAERLSLVDRGFVFALAHIRGGQELGRTWYETGRLLRKKNTFTDFIDVTLYLVEGGWGHPDRVVASGRSAGGLLMGAIANMRPDLYEIVVTEVPFVDVITTMLDESIPLTTFEFDEWGNPRDREYYDYMMSYSPYDQVAEKAYPNMLVSSGLWDPAVQYWEPAKWVAKLRARKTDDNLLLLYTDMDAGHSGPTGRFERMRDRAREYAFIFDVLGIESD